MTKKKCPKCKGELKEIIYGLPGGELIEAEERDEVVLGGCCIRDESPKYHCDKCDLDFSRGLKESY